MRAKSLKQRCPALCINIVNLRLALVQVFIQQMIKLCRQYSGEGIKIPSPCQQKKIHKVLFKKAAKANQHLTSTFHRKNWCLYFVDKGIQYKTLNIKLWF